ncbi:hypothetical protein D3C78_1888880 [compost metagenome]
MVATDRKAKAKVHTVTENRALRIEESVTARVKFSKPTLMDQPGISCEPSCAVYAPTPVSRYTTPVC